MTGVFLSILGGLFFFLKILLLLLLGCILLALFLLALILLVPIRYKGRISYKEKFLAEGEISWLFRCIILKAEYKEGLEALGKVLWFKKVFWLSREEEQEPVRSLAGEERKEAKKQVPSSLKIPLWNGEREKSSQPPKKTKKKRADGNHPTIKENPSPKANVKKREDSVAGKSLSLFQNWFNRGRRIWETVTSSENQACVFFLLEKLRSLLMHLLPQKIRGSITFGFEDPSTTGQILGYLAVFYGLYQDSFIIVPVFDEKILEAELDFKGRVRLLYIVYLAARVFFNRNCRRVYKKFRRRNT